MNQVVKPGQKGHDSQAVEKIISGEHKKGPEQCKEKVVAPVVQFQHGFGIADQQKHQAVYQYYQEVIEQ